MGFGQARTWLDLATATFAAINKPVEIEWIAIPENIRNQSQYFTEANMERLYASEGIKPAAWALEKGVGDYVRNYLLQPEKYL